jgi:hypothetical protein
MSYVCCMKLPIVLGNGIIGFGSGCRPISNMRAGARSAPISAISSTHPLRGSAIWWAFGEHHHVARRKIITTDPGWRGPAHQTCANAAALCRAFEISHRPEVLSFSHHAAVAALTPAEQDGLLDQAEREGWSRRQLRVQAFAPIIERVREAQVILAL